jgi:2-ketoarginine methyltransferase
MLTVDFERRLIENLQPIRYFALAQALHHSMDLGIFAAVGAAPGLDGAELATDLGLDPDRLLVLLRYLENEGYVLDDGGWSLTPKGVGLPVFAPWYELLVGGYATTFQQLGDVLRKGAPWATRDATRVGAGSCGISAYDALPLAERLLDAAPQTPATVVDLGCGDAGFLVELLVRRPALRGVGVEPNLSSVELGATRARAAGVTDRLRLHHGPAADVTTLELPERGRGTCFLTAFVLQEILEQGGERAVEDFLRSTFEAHPEALWLVVEVDHRPSGPVMAHGLATAYYNPYFLIHGITEQRLEPARYWSELFGRLGLRILQVGYPDDRVDSTRLELGYLLCLAPPRAPRGAAGPLPGPPVIAGRP